ncbi:MAG: acyltransferase family protein, partial [Duncaniella sp.]|nr:acyltransferase family protein [Duncaniella sp.]
LTVDASIVAVLPVKFIFSIIYVFPVMQLPPFVAGILVWMAFSRYPAAKAGRLTVSLLQIGAVALIIVFIIFYPRVNDRWGVASYWWIPDFALLYIMLVAERFDTPLNRLLRLCPMQIAGNVSFVFYLFHTIVMNIYRRALEAAGIELPPVPSSIVCILLTFAVAWVLHYYVELPVAARLKKILM